MNSIDACLLKAILDETLSVDRYRTYAQKAEEEEYYQIAAYFEQIANNEREHAERFRKLLNNKTAIVNNIATDYQVSDKTEENLLISIRYELDAIEEYKDFELIASAKGYREIATAFKEIREVEEHHVKIFNTFKDNIQNNLVYRRKTIVAWHCRNCGYVHFGTEPPKPTCPACKETYRYYEILATNY